MKMINPCRSRESFRVLLWRRFLLRVSVVSLLGVMASCSTPRQEVALSPEEAERNRLREIAVFHPEIVAPRVPKVAQPPSKKEDPATKEGVSADTKEAPSSTPATPESVPEKTWDEWSAWIEKIRPVGDDQGHGPDIGGDEWAQALDRNLGLSDAEGHGPDLKSMEWRRAVESKLGR